ncbi:MAG: hypothetical protein IEMM0001_0194 [bacterium]|nr:MAG: hypothetical protein IEMM0001_0194 [bacterium]
MASTDTPSACCGVVHLINRLDPISCSAEKDGRQCKSLCLLLIRVEYSVRMRVHAEADLMGAQIIEKNAKAEF